MAIYEIYPEQRQSSRLIVGDLGNCAFKAGSWGPDGLLYGARSSTGEIVRVNVDSGEIQPAFSGLTYPVNVKFDAQGRLIVADSQTGEITRIDPGTGVKTVLVTLTPGTFGLALDAQDRLYISNEIEGSIVEIAPDDTLRIVQPAGLIFPGGIAITDDTLYDDGKFLVVVEVAARRLSLVDLSTGVVKPLAEDLAIGVTATRFFHPTWIFNGVAIDEEVPIRRATGQEGVRKLG